MKFFLNCLLFISSNFVALGQSPSIVWQNCIGGTNLDAATDIIATSDGGYIFTGSSRSNDGDLTNNHGATDVFLVKLDALGNVQWQRTYGGTLDDGGVAIKQTVDGGYVLACASISMDIDVIGNHGNWDYWILKLDTNGNIQWKKCFGGSSVDVPEDIIQCNDGSYIIVGNTTSNDGDVTGLNSATNDAWVIKIDAIGTLLWQKCIGTISSNRAFSIIQTIDNGYAFVGETEIGSQLNGWLVKLNALGGVQWQKSFGGTNNDGFKSILQTIDGGYVLAGGTFSNDNDVSGNHGQIDSWIVKVDSLGNLNWQKCFGGSLKEAALDIVISSGGGYIFASYTESLDFDVTNNHGIRDWWIVKVDATGAILWEKCLGTTSIEEPTSIIQIGNNDYVICGSVNANDGDASGFNGGNGDAWVVKLSNTIDIHENNINFKALIYPNPTQNTINIQFSEMLKNNGVIQIYDLGGRFVRSIQIEKNIKEIAVNSSSMLNGVYTFQVIIDDLVWFNGRFIIAD
jgi:hypothetical protein